MVLLKNNAGQAHRVLSPWENKPNNNKQTKVTNLMISPEHSLSSDCNKMYIV